MTAKQRMAQHPAEILRVEDLTIRFRRQAEQVTVVNQLSLTVKRGETLALVGESGSGKSVTSLALIGLLPAASAEVSGARWLRKRHGQQVNLAEITARQWQKIRGADIAMIFQEPMTSLNPVFTIGEQIAEPLRMHQHLSARDAQRETLNLLDKVRIPGAQSLMQRYPHQLSGGMRQRVMIALALSCKPVLLIADEPTTALDVTLQAQILALIRELQQELETGIIFITHDMGVVAEMADRVTVLKQGHPLETAPVRQLFRQAQHPYTRHLLASVPRLGEMQDQPYPVRFFLPGERAAVTESNDTVRHTGIPLLQVNNLVIRFPVRSGLLNRITHHVHAVEHVSFELRAGETLALVGESGCGKSTTGRALLQLVESQSGEIIFEGQRIDRLRGRELNQLRQNIQFVFQDPYASLDPRKTAGYSIMEPLRVHRLMSREDAARRVGELLERVGLEPAAASRYPHEFSGGQRQRICIARALAVNPKVVVADEAVSALDVSVQAQILNLMLELQREHGIAFLFISHDMAVVERISHRVAVMYQGQIVETGSREAVFTRPGHAYTQKLLASVPVADPDARPAAPAEQITELPSAIYPSGQGPVRWVLKPVGEQHFVATAQPQPYPQSAVKNHNS